MIKRLKKMVFSCFLAVLCGSISGRIVYSIYNEKVDIDINGEKIYLVQAGAYSSYDNMVSHTSLGNYVYYEDEDGLYKSIIGITEDYDNLSKIKNTYQDEVVIREYYSKDKELNKQIKNYDKKIKDANEDDEVANLVTEMLSLYKDKKATLIQIKS